MNTSDLIFTLTLYKAEIPQTSHSKVMPSYNFAISNRIMYEENIQYSTRKEQEESTWM